MKNKKYLLSYSYANLAHSYKLAVSWLTRNDPLKFSLPFSLKPLVKSDLAMFFEEFRADSTRWLTATHDEALIRIMDKLHYVNDIAEKSLIVLLNG